GGAILDAAHDTTFGVHGVNVVNSIAAAAATDFVRLTKSEVIAAPKTIAGLIIAGDNITVSGAALTVSNGSIQMGGAGSAQATISASLTLGAGANAESVIQVDEGNTLTITSSLTDVVANTLRKRGLGTLVLTGSNGVSLASPISVDQGVLRVGSN